MNGVKTALAVLCVAAQIAAGTESRRTIISLNGTWQIEETASPDVLPESYSGTVPVPGLIDMAGPTPFEDVGYETAYKRYFWYRREFTVGDSIPDTALLKINKAKFISQVYVNGKFVGENPHNFTPGIFDVKRWLKAKKTNELVVRITTYENTPPTIMNGFDAEKKRYIPGIYDDVSLILSGQQFIENVQVVPDVEHKAMRAVVQLKSGAGEAAVTYRIRECNSGKVVASGEADGLDFTVPIPGCKLWSPASPFLYTLELETESDSYSTRFGMRSFRLDHKTGKAYLNGKPFYMHGTNVCIFRFFEDPDRNGLPWDEAWVRKLFRKMKTMHWDSIRFTIGFPPERWYEIADEEGFLIQDEYPIWYNNERRISLFKKDLSLIHVEFEKWMRERWNHPCVVIWDAQNETTTTKTGDAIRKVRHLDLSNRPWDNGRGAPVDINDVAEVHPYLYNKFRKDENPIPEEGLLKYALSTVRIPDNGPAQFTPPVSGAEQYPNPFIINEYAWLWINRNGTPTSLTEVLYPKAFGKLTKEQLYTTYARHLAMKTEYWRVHRKCAGVLQFCVLSYSRPEEPKGETSDNFVDIKNLIFEPTYERYVKDAFSPVTLMIDFWESEVSKDRDEEIRIMIINDTYTDWAGKLKLTLRNAEGVVFKKRKRVEVDALGKISVSIPVQWGVEPGACSLTAELKYNGDKVQSIREFEVR
ncbi:glycoside hydrolase family 2 protein [Pontiella agarivorans]|uniref:Glycoside hydrolase family 2 TIM barrel-domain containing protein n=1 Tax=Pontiella agarivorans TaxID=3038953 RepID=A0ABU5MS59_9BACT|nr:glycoside hydrolase family 2 TIM barrel-domain containing protein [Pontiella agarivorans]MDZ8117007.1 glycoside hydrolase family 2 TIM barrel-domain containing protein [Pontiella agarivorans]